MNAENSLNVKGRYKNKKVKGGPDSTFSSSFILLPHCSRWKVDVPVRPGNPASRRQVILLQEAGLFGFAKLGYPASWSRLTRFLKQMIQIREVDHQLYEAR